MSQFFASGGQSTGVSASTSVLPMNKLESRLLGEISITSDMQITSPYGRKSKSRLWFFLWTCMDVKVGL